MSHDESRKEKKHKKDKNHKREEQVDDKAAMFVPQPAVKEKKKKEKDIPEEVVDEPLREKKSKKAKKSKKEVEVDEAEIEADPISSPKKEKKNKKEKIQIDEYGVVEPVFEKVKKSKKEKREVSEPSEESTPIKKAKVEAVEMETPTASSSTSYDNDWSEENNTGGAKYWKRIDEGKYKNKVEGTKFAKISHYDKGGDSWGNQAADILGQVKGKGFVKAMQKLKRASWKGQGTIDTGVNAVQFSDWEE